MNRPTQQQEEMAQQLIGVRGHWCQACGFGCWNEQPIPLRVFPLDGNQQNLQVDNLSLVCFNCYAVKILESK